MFILYTHTHKRKNLSHSFHHDKPLWARSCPCYRMFLLMCSIFFFSASEAANNLRKNNTTCTVPIKVRSFAKKMDDTSKDLSRVILFKTGLKIFVVVMPKEGVAGSNPPRPFFGMTPMINITREDNSVIPKEGFCQPNLPLVSQWQRS